MRRPISAHFCDDPRLTEMVACAASILFDRGLDLDYVERQSMDLSDLARRFGEHRCHRDDYRFPSIPASVVMSMFLYETQWIKLTYGLDAKLPSETILRSLSIMDVGQMLLLKLLWLEALQYITLMLYKRVDPEDPNVVPIIEMLIQVMRALGSLIHSRSDTYCDIIDGIAMSAHQPLLDVHPHALLICG